MESKPQSDSPDLDSNSKPSYCPPCLMHRRITISFRLKKIKQQQKQTNKQTNQTKTTKMCKSLKGNFRWHAVDTFVLRSVDIFDANSNPMSWAMILFCIGPPAPAPEGCPTRQHWISFINIVINLQKIHQDSFSVPRRMKERIVMKFLEEMDPNFIAIE